MVACSTNKGLPRKCLVFYDSLYRNLALVPIQIGREAKCESRGCEFDPGPIFSWRLIMKYFLRSSVFLIEGKLSFTSKSMCTEYWLAYQGKKCG